MGAMHSALVPLEDKGYIKSYNGEVTEERMGRPKNTIASLHRKRKQWSMQKIQGMNSGVPFQKSHCTLKIAY
jgi:PadR family transcriptional regulator, regulatory protein PadR